MTVQRTSYGFLVGPALLTFLSGIHWAVGMGVTCGSLFLRSLPRLASLAPASIPGRRSYWGQDSDLTDVAVKTAILATPGPVQKAYREQRRQLFENLFDYYQTPRQSLPDLPLNLWTIGSFDPVAFHAPPGEGLPDSDILKRMKSYSGISTP